MFIFGGVLWDNMSEIYVLRTNNIPVKTSHCETRGSTPQFG